MTEDPFEALSAFVDGEASDPSELAEALATPGAREALIDFVRIRGLMAADPTVPSPQFYAAMDRALAGTSAPSGSPWRRRLGAGLAAAALVVAGLLGGFAIRGRAGAAAEKDVPPTPSREVRFTEGVDWFPS